MFNLKNPNTCTAFINVKTSYILTTYIVCLVFFVNIFSKNISIYMYIMEYTCCCELWIKYMYSLVKSNMSYSNNILFCLFSMDNVTIESLHIFSYTKIVDIDIERLSPYKLQSKSEKRFCWNNK